MLDKLKSLEARRQFLVVSVLAAVVALGANLLLVQESIHHAPTALNASLQQVSAGIFTGAVTAAFITLMFSWLLGKEESLTLVETLDPLRIRREHEKALNETDFWFHLGHWGRWTRIEAIPALSKRAMASGRKFRVCLIVIDPSDAAACGAFTAYRNQVRSGGNPATSEQTIAEILATVVCAATASQHFLAMDVSLFFTHHFSSSRLDVSSSVAFATLVNPRAPALAYFNRPGRVSTFYDAALNDFEVMKSLSIPFRPAAPLTLPLTAEKVKAFLEENHLPAYNDEQMVEDVIKRASSTDHPYR
jgi:hypothetical protein